MAEKNEVKVEKLGDVALLDIKGDVTRTSAPFIEEAFRKRDVEQAPKLLLRFYSTTYFNSEGIKVLIQLLAESKRNQQQVGITGLSKHFKKIFGMVGIKKLATIFNSMGEALEDLTGSGEEST
jgi:anti-anti-sigma factor